MSAGLKVAREALAGERAWLVGGAVRDRLLGRPVEDLDVIVAGDPAEAAYAVARAAGRAACFALSRDFGSWRVLARDGSWQLDVEPLRADGLEADLALRDFTVNAIAEPLAGGAALDPLGGLEDLRERRLRMAGARAFADDPLRVLRLARMAVELELEPEARTLAAALAAAPRLAEVAAERAFTELRRIIASPDPRRGLELMDRTGASAAVLPELGPMRGVAQNRFHHLDVYDHTLEVLDRAVELTGPRSPGDPQLRAGLGDHVEAVRALLAEPLADGLTRGEALRWGALLHDAAKPATRSTVGGTRVTFIGHDVLGADLARRALTRLRASERVRAHVAALVRNHLRLGFLVHEEQPLARSSVYAYMRACDPVPVDVTLLSIADRLATRGDRAEESIAAHLAVAVPMLGDALAWREHGPPRPLLRGDELARELGIAPGPRLGDLLAALSEAQYGGEVATREQAIAFARARRANV